ncbi:Retrovirus-related Pol polyprotein from transposon TNT 1-94 [Vitis vinifera]|uniref:Retrovirus-related Pol polyprotein from transposon TNT 1-94 n=1 Tax=Vitis vinifera TaxID=29760 RepID=A0A438BQR5_VITVI|nr:Retrovirus-related Pol polyprotein from transposon TNT 1-94 [Vitis vinifera]
MYSHNRFKTHLDSSYSSYGTIQVHEEVTQQPQVQVPLRRSTRERRSTISDDYVVYLQEHEFDMGLEDDPISVSQVKQSSDSEKWIEAMKDEMKSMKDNGVWDLVELPKGVKRLVVNGFLNQAGFKRQIVRSIGIVQRYTWVSQKAYIDKVLSRFGMSNCAPGDTPVAKGDKFSLHQCPKNELEKKDMERFPYASVVGSLMYAQVCTRPDIAYIVGISSHLEIGIFGLRFRCLDSRRSTSGYIFMLAGGVVSWKSVKQTLIASFHHGGRIHSLLRTSNHGIWLRNFVTQLKVDGIEKPLRINCDNKAAELYSKNNRSSSKSKHIDIKFLVVKERVQSLQVSIEHISTNSMIAIRSLRVCHPKYIMSMSHIWVLYTLMMC